MRRHGLISLALLGLLAACTPGDQPATGTPWQLTADDAGPPPTDTGVDTTPDPPPDTRTDTGTCPDRDDPDVEYLEPSQCESGALFCQEPNKRFFRSACGCGCITTEECPDRVMRRDGSCNRECSHVDPDCADCPDPDDPNINYVGNSYEDPSQCRLLDYTCRDKWKGFSRRRCGCGCRKDTSQCPDPADPEIDYVSEDPEECETIFIDCEENEEPFSNGCGCGCRQVEEEGPCAPQEARSQGGCGAVIGIKFDGDRCRTMSGCSCEGDDCDNLYDSRWKCTADHAMCIERDPCSAHPQTDGEGGDPPCRVRYAWDGRSCKALCNEDCDSSLCYGLYENPDACAAAHSHCR